MVVCKMYGMQAYLATSIDSLVVLYKKHAWSWAKSRKTLSIHYDKPGIVCFQEIIIV